MTWRQFVTPGKHLLKTTKIWITKTCTSDSQAVLSSSSHTRISFNVSNFSTIRQKCSNSSVSVKCNNCCSHSLILCSCLLLCRSSWRIAVKLLRQWTFIPFHAFKHMLHLSLTYVAMLYIPPPNGRFHLSTLGHHLRAIFALPPFKFVFINYCSSSAWARYYPRRK